MVIFASLIVFSCSEVCALGQALPPVGEPPWMTWGEQLANSHLAALTAEIVRDAMGRMRSAEERGKKFEENIMYKVGAVASSIQHLFDNMVKIYRDVANTTRLQRLDWWYADAINRTEGAISMCQSLLHRIRLEKRLFLEIVRAEETGRAPDQPTHTFGLQGAHRPHTAGPAGAMKGGMFVPRRANDWLDDDFEFKFDFLEHTQSRRMYKPISDNVEEKPRKVLRGKERVKLAPDPGDNITIRTSDILGDPYAELATLLSESGAELNLLGLIPGREPQVRRATQTRDKLRNQYANQTIQEPVDMFHGRRVADSVASKRRVGHKQPLWRPASDLHSSSTTQLSTITDGSNNNNGERKEKLTKRTSGIEKSKKPIWTPNSRRLNDGAEYNAPRSYTSRQSVSNHIQVYKKPAITNRPPSQPARTVRRGKQNTLPKTTRQDSNTAPTDVPSLDRRDSQISKVPKSKFINKQPLWQPGRNQRRYADGQ